MRVGVRAKSGRWPSGVSVKLRFSFSQLPVTLNLFRQGEFPRGAVALVLTKRMQPCHTDKELHSEVLKYKDDTKTSRLKKSQVLALSFSHNSIRPFMSASHVQVSKCAHRPENKTKAGPGNPLIHCCFPVQLPTPNPSREPAGPASHPHLRSCRQLRGQYHR